MMKGIRQLVQERRQRMQEEELERQREEAERQASVEKLCQKLETGLEETDEVEKIIRKEQIRLLRAGINPSTAIMGPAIWGIFALLVGYSLSPNTAMAVEKKNRG